MIEERLRGSNLVRAVVECSSCRARGRSFIFDARTGEKAKAAARKDAAEAWDIEEVHWYSRTRERGRKTKWERI